MISSSYINTGVSIIIGHIHNKIDITRMMPGKYDRVAHIMVINEILYKQCLNRSCTIMVIIKLCWL